MPGGQDALGGRSGRACDVLCVGGGVAANGRLRAAAGRRNRAAQASSCTLPPLSLCTDNAVMGAIALERLAAGLVESLDLDAYPGLIVREASATLALAAGYRERQATV